MRNLEKILESLFVNLSDSTYLDALQNVTYLRIIVVGTLFLSFSRHLGNAMRALLL